MYNLIGYEGDVYAHVLVVVKGGAVVEIGDVYTSEFFFAVRDGAIDENFDGGDGGAGGGGIASLVEFVAADSDADPFLFFLGGSDCRDEPGVGGAFSSGDRRFGNENDRVFPRGNAGADALSKASEVVC